MKKMPDLPTLKSYTEFAAVAAAQSKVDAAIGENKRLLDTLKIKGSRLSQDGRRFVSQNAMALPAMSDGALDRLASEIIAAGGSVPPGLIARLRAALPALSWSDSYDAEIIEQIDSARASAELLERAAVLLKRKLSTTQTAAKAELFQVLRHERHAITSQIIAAHQKWAEALRMERGLAERIRSEGMDAILDIGHFPELPRLDHESCRWMARILETSESGLRMRMDDAQPDESIAAGGAR